MNDIIMHDLSFNTKKGDKSGMNVAKFVGVTSH